MGAEPPHLRRGGAELRPTPLEPLEGLSQDAPHPSAQSGASATAELTGWTSSWLLIGASDPNPSGPGKPRSWAWLRAGGWGAGTPGLELTPPPLSWSPACRSSLQVPCPPPTLSCPVLGCRPPQLFLFSNCTVWSVAAPSARARVRPPRFRPGPQLNSPPGWTWGQTAGDAGIPVSACLLPPRRPVATP